MLKRNKASNPIPVNESLLDIKERELDGLVRRSTDAIDIVTSTIHNLENVNGEIETRISEIKEYQEKLEQTRNKLGKTQDNNSKIIGNFKKLIEA